MGKLIIQYGGLYLQLPDDDLDSIHFVGEVLQFFINRILEAEG